MSHRLRQPVIVLGGGVLGITCGLALLEAGARVTIVDPAQVGANASGVAAGMLAPASEALSDPQNFERLRRARDLWPVLAEQIGARIDATGAVHLGANAQVHLRRQALAATGAVCELCDPPPWVSRSGLTGFVTSDDWRLDAVEAIAKLQSRFLGRGGLWRVEPEALAESEVVVAAGFGARLLADLAPEAIHLAPIKGQIARLDAGPATGASVRYGGRYFVPHARGLIVGATMEFNVSDTTVDATAIEALQVAAAELSPSLARASAQGQAAVRAATGDGWPLVGASRRRGVWLATGARRNGWLLAPLIARVLVARMRGDVPDQDAQAFDPRRFDH